MKMIECDICGEKDYEDNFSYSAEVKGITVNRGVVPKKVDLWITFLVRTMACNESGLDEDVDICPACRVTLVKKAISQYADDHKEWMPKDSDIAKSSDGIREGKVKKGGVNSPPTTPRPMRPSAMGDGMSDMVCCVCKGELDANIYSIEKDGEIFRTCENCGNPGSLG